MRETTDDGLVVLNVGADGGSRNLVGTQSEPPQQSSINVKAGKMTKAFDACCCCSIIEFINRMACD
jgi:hypothetical protein